MSREVDPFRSLGQPVLQILRSWESEGLASALQRPPTDAASGDVDVLVAPGDLPRSEAFLRSAGWLLAPSAGHGSHRFWVLRDPDSGQWHHIDVVTRLDFGPSLAYHTDLAADCLARRVRREPSAVLHPDDMFWLTLLHQIWKEETPARRLRLTNLAREATVDGPVARFIAGLIGNDGEALHLGLAAVRSDDIRAFRQFSDRVLAGWRRSRTFEIAGRHAASFVRRRLPPRRSVGRSVALMGLDGAGKSTVGTRLHQEMPWPSVWMYMGVWQESRLDRLLRGVLGAQLVLRLARLSGVALRTRYHRRMGRVVILDRYVVDATLPSADLDWKGRVSAVLVLRTAAVPDRLVFLDASPEVVFARKGEFTFEELSGRREHYRGLARTSPRWVTVDASQPLDDVVAEVGAIVWADLTGRASAQQPVVAAGRVTPEREVAVAEEGVDEVRGHGPDTRP